MTVTITVTNPERIPADIDRAAVTDAPFVPAVTVRIVGLDRDDVDPNLLDDLFGNYDTAEVS